MKKRRILSLIFCIIMVLSAAPVSAIGFNAEDKYDSVFVISSGTSLGSGFAIGKNCVVTNAHVISDINDITLTTYSKEKYTAFLIGFDKEKDIAILGVEKAEFPYLQADDYTSMTIGDEVYAIGAPKSMTYTLTKGVISSKKRKIGNYTYIQTDAAINEGNSGGPLINDAGNVIGINTLKMSDSEGIGLAIPMTVVSEFIRSLNIDIDENGNVTAVIEPNENTTDNFSDEFNNNATNDIVKSPDASDDKTNTDKSAPLYTVTLIVSLCVSIGVNIVLIIMLIFQKKKNLTLKYDPRERTDFDIDILE